MTITKTAPLWAMRLKDGNFPIDVRFAGGWRTVHYVTADILRGEDIVTLWDRDGREVAKVYPLTTLFVRLEDK